jgi:hypothetical protein
MRTPMSCKLVGRWRIVEADIWDRQYLDLCRPATIVVRANGRGEIAFGALQAGLDINGPSGVACVAWGSRDRSAYADASISTLLYDRHISLLPAAF